MRLPKPAYGIGFSYMGLIPGRDSDELGIGINYSRLSPRIVASGHAESEAELFYRARLTRWLTLQPELRYVNDRAAHVHSAFSPGFRFVIAF